MHSREQSSETWREYFLRPIKEVRIPGPNNESYDPTVWVEGKEIRIFKMPGINKRVIPSVYTGLRDLITEVGLDFRINYFEDSSVIKQVNQATNHNGLDGDRLGEILAGEHWRIPKYGGKPHADIIIVDTPFSKNPQDWGQSQFVYGYMVLTLSGNRQNSLDFIRNITKHEAGHLLGFQEHHDSSLVRDYGKVKDCNMNWQASTLYTCEKCLDAIRFFWKGMEARKRMKFFK